MSAIAPYSPKNIYWLSHNGREITASESTTHLFRVIGRALGRRMCDITVKHAVDVGFQIRRAGV